MPHFRINCFLMTPIGLCCDVIEINVIEFMTLNHKCKPSDLDISVGSLNASLNTENYL